MNKKQLILPISIGVVALAAIIAAILIGVTGHSTQVELTAKIIQQNEIIGMLQSDLDELSQTQTVYRAKIDIKSGNTIRDTDIESIQVSVKFTADYSTSAEDIVGNVAIADIGKGSYITKEFVYPVELKNDYRTLDVICDRNPIGFNIGDTVDVRITFPNGQDFVLLSKKLVDDVYGNVVRIVVDEKDVLIYKSAEADWARFTKNGTAGAAVQVYCTTYVAAGAQTSSTQYYPIQTKLPDGQTFEGSTYWVALNDYNLSESDLSNWLAVDRDKLERALRDYDYYWTDSVTYEAHYKYQDIIYINGSSRTDWAYEDAMITCLDNDKALEIAIKNAFGTKVLQQSNTNVLTLTEIDRYRILDTTGGATEVNNAKQLRDEMYVAAAKEYSTRQQTLTAVQEHEKEKAEENGEPWTPWSETEVLEWTKRYIDGIDLESYQIEQEKKKEEEGEKPTGVGATDYVD